MRTGEMWAITKHGIEPDIIVTGKGLSGGMYPITAAMLERRAAGNGSTRTGSRTSRPPAAPSSAASSATRCIEMLQRPELVASLLR